MANDVGVEEARSRFGGVDIAATVAGALAALGTAVVLAGVLAGAGTFGYQLGLDNAAETVTVGGLVGGLLTLLVALLVGGWVPGRVARYDGGRNRFCHAGRRLDRRTPRRAPPPPGRLARGPYPPGCRGPAATGGDKGLVS